MSYVICCPRTSSRSLQSLVLPGSNWQMNGCLWLHGRSFHLPLDLCSTQSSLLTLLGSPEFHCVYAVAFLSGVSHLFSCHWSDKPIQPGGGVNRFAFLLLFIFIFTCSLTTEFCFDAATNDGVKVQFYTKFEHSAFVSVNQ